jgi:hypothetical protein
VPVKHRIAIDFHGHLYHVPNTELGVGDGSRMNMRSFKWKTRHILMMVIDNKLLMIIGDN